MALLAQRCSNVAVYLYSDRVTKKMSTATDNEGEEVPGVEKKEVMGDAATLQLAGEQRLGSSMEKSVREGAEKDRRSMGKFHNGLLGRSVETDEDGPDGDEEEEVFDS